MPIILLQVIKMKRRSSREIFGHFLGNLMVYYFSVSTIIILGKTYTTYLKRLTTLQNRAVKISVEAHWRDYTAYCYMQLQVLKLNKLHTYEVAKFMYKYTSKNLPPPSFSFFTSVASVHKRSTRLASSQYSLYLPRYKTLRLQRNIKVQGVKI